MPPPCVAPIQVKGSGTERFRFEKIWFATPGISLVLVWNALAVRENPRFFVFGCLQDAEVAIGVSVSSASWQTHGAYSVTAWNGRLPKSRQAAMASHEDRWERITSKLQGPTPSC